MAAVTVKSLVTSRNLRALALVLAASAIVAAAIFTYRYDVYSRLLGPFDITPSEVAKLTALDGEPRRFVKLAESPMQKTPLRDITTHTRRGRETGKTIQNYFALPSQPLVLVRTPEEKLTFPVTAALVPVPQTVWERLDKINPAIRSNRQVAPFMLDAEDAATSWGTIWAAAAVIIPAGLLILLGRSLYRLADYRRHPAVAGLKRLDAAIDRVVGDVDASLAADGGKRVLSSLLLTPAWLVYQRPLKLELMNLGEVVWMYPAVSTRKIWGLIPISWSHYLRIGDRNGRMLSVKGRKAAVPDALVAIAQRVPWIFAGYSEELQAAYSKNRAAFVAAVDERRQQILNPPPQQMPPQGAPPAQGQAG